MSLSERERERERERESERAEHFVVECEGMTFHLKSKIKLFFHFKKDFVKYRLNKAGLNLQTLNA